MKLSNLSYRREETGFTYVELLIVILIMGLIAGLGTWMLFGTQSTNAANAGQNQIASDLRLAAEMSKVSKTPWGICFHDRDALGDKNSYWWFNTAYADDATPSSPIKPPKGAAPNAANSKYVKPPNGAFISTPDELPEPTILYIRFKPVGAVIYAQYMKGDGTWENVGDSVRVRITDKGGAVQRDVYIYRLGDIGT